MIATETPRSQPFHGGWSPLNWRLKQHQILVADDEPHILQLVQHRLERIGYDVLPALDGESALELIEEFEPALCLLDVMMPRLNGWDVLRELRATPGYDPRVIMLSALGSDADIAHAYDLGADAYMVKPFGMLDLLTHVRVYLGHR